jgi:hypothetical protein
MAELMVMIYDRRAVNASASEEMYRALSGTWFRGEAIGVIPPYVQTASKQGASDRSIAVRGGDRQRPKQPIRPERDNKKPGRHELGLRQCRVRAFARHLANDMESR